MKLVCPRAFVTAKTSAIQSQSTGLALLQHIESLEIPLYGDLTFDQHTLWLLANVKLASLTVRLKAEGPAVKMFPDQLTQVVDTTHLAHLSLINDTRNLMLSTLFEWRCLLRKCSDTLESLHCFKLSECRLDEPIMLYPASRATPEESPRPLVFSKLHTLSLYHIRAIRGVEFAESIWLERLASIMPRLQTLKLGYVNIGLAKLFMRKTALTIQVLHLDDETCEWLQRGSGETTSVTVQLFRYLQGIPNLRLRSLYLQDLPLEAAKMLPLSIETLKVKRCSAASLEILCEAQQSTEMRLNRVQIEQDIPIECETWSDSYFSASKNSASSALQHCIGNGSGPQSRILGQPGLQCSQYENTGSCSTPRLPVQMV